MSSQTPGATDAGAPSGPSPRLQLRLLVGVHDGLVSGINTYIENVAVAAATAVTDVTLLVADDTLAERVGRRVSDRGVRVVSLAMAAPSSAEAIRSRLSPAYAAQRLASAVRRAPARVGTGYDAVHLNHPHLARALRPAARRVYVAAWFYPHSLGSRVRRTWLDSGGRFPRSAVLAMKGALHYRNDARGYADADLVVAPTRLLEADLRRRGIAAMQCTPPAGSLPVAAPPPARDARGAPRLLVCCGDLGHPRKNVALALEALRILGTSGTRLELELIGGNAHALVAQLRRMPATITVASPGRLPEQEVQRRMRAADALLFPSRYEEWGYVAVEAALQGTPVITLPVYPFAEMLPAPLGVRAEGTTPAAYATAITRCLAGAPDRAAVVASAEGRFGAVKTGQSLAAVWTTSRAEATGRRGQPPG